MEDISQEGSKLSKINSAVLNNLRISNLWFEINKAAVSGNYFRWNSYLDRIWCELVGDVRKKTLERKEFKELNKDVSEKMSKLKSSQGFEKFSKDDRINFQLIYDSLLKKEDFLRTLMNKQGKGTAYHESWDDYIHG